MLGDPYLDAEAMARNCPYAVVIEPHCELAETIREALARAGFHADVASTHAHAARMAEGRCPQVLVACQPAAWDATDAYLAECRDALGSLPTILLLTSDDVESPECPRRAVVLLKPFTQRQLLASVEYAMTLDCTTRVT